MGSESELTVGTIAARAESAGWLTTYKFQVHVEQVSDLGFGT